MFPFKIYYYITVMGEILSKLANPLQLIHKSRWISACRFRGEFASYCRELASFDKKVSPDNHRKSQYQPTNMLESEFEIDTILLLM